MIIDSDEEMYSVASVAAMIHRDPRYVSDLCRKKEIDCSVDTTTNVKKYKIPKSTVDILVAQFNELMAQDDLWVYKRTGSGKYIRRSKVGILSDRKLWYSPTGASVKLNRSPGTIRNMCNNGIIECVRLEENGKVFFYINEDVINSIVAENKD